MAALSSGTDDIVAQSGVTIAAPDTSYSPPSGTYTNQTATYSELQLQVKYCMKQFTVLLVDWI